MQPGPSIRHQMDPVQHSLSVAGIQGSAADNEDHGNVSSDGNQIQIEDKQARPMLRREYEAISPAPSSSSQQAHPQAAQAQPAHPLPVHPQPAQVQPGPSSVQPRSAQARAQSLLAQAHPAREAYRRAAVDVGKTLPLLEEVPYVQVEPRATRSKVNSVAEALKAGLQEFYQMGLDKAKLEDDYIKVHQALHDQREVVRQVKDRCNNAFDAANDEYTKMLAPLYTELDTMTADLHLSVLQRSQMESRVVQLEATISQLEATVASKDAEIALLKEQNNRLQNANQPGRSPFASPPSRPKRPAPTVGRGAISPLSTPQHEADYQYGNAM